MQFHIRRNNAKKCFAGYTILTGILKTVTNITLYFKITYIYTLTLINTNINNHEVNMAQFVAETDTLSTVNLNC